MALVNWYLTILILVNEKTGKFQRIRKTIRTAQNLMHQNEYIQQMEQYVLHKK